MATTDFHLPGNVEGQISDEMNLAKESFPPGQVSFKRALLATDFSDASRSAFQASLGLCHAFKMSLFILHASEYGSVRYLESGEQAQELDSIYRGWQSSLHTMVQEAKRLGIQCVSAVSEGIAHSTILETVDSKDIDLVILGTRSIHGFERLVFGSTAEAVIREAKCPVFTVGPQAAVQPSEAGTSGGIVFATDFHISTTAALHYAAFFSTTMNLPLHCLNVLPRSLEYGDHRELVSLLIVEALRHLAASIDHKIPTPICAVAYGSEISNAVVDYARQQDAKLIVLGIRRASLAASHIPAHIAYRIIAEAPCPVLTITFPSGDSGASTSYGCHT